MWRSFTRWLGRGQLADPVHRRQAGTLQVMMLVILGACVVGLPLGLLTSRGGASSFFLFAYPIIAACTLVGFAVLRRGHFKAAVYLTTAGILLALVVVLLGSGVQTGGITYLTFSVPLVMAGLLLGRRGLLVISGASILMVVAIGALDQIAPELVGSVPTPSSFASIVSGFVLVTGVLGLLLDRFSTSLRDALEAALLREQELEQIRNSQEQIIAQRTASLEEALEAVQQREASLVETLAELRASQETVRALSAPVLPVLPGVLVAPVVGSLDAQRASDLAANVLAQVERRNARSVVLDITGVPLVDSHVAQALLNVAQSVRLLGARTVLVGIRPEVAQTMVSLGVDLGALETCSDLQEAVGRILQSD